MPCTTRSRKFKPGRRISSESCSLLCAGGPVSPRASLTLLSRCSLEGNYIGEEGAAALSEALKINATLTSLK